MRSIEKIDGFRALAIALADYWREDGVRLDVDERV